MKRLRKRVELEEADLETQRKALQIEYDAATNESDGAAPGKSHYPELLQEAMHHHEKAGWRYSATRGEWARAPNLAAADHLAGRQIDRLMRVRLQFAPAQPIQRRDIKFAFLLLHPRA